MIMNPRRRGRRLVLRRISRALYQRSEQQLIRVLRVGLVGFEGGEEVVDAENEAIVYYALVLEGGDLVTPPVALLVDLGLFGADKGFLVDVGVDFDVRVVADFERVLGSVE
jgi:hypothetical protein